MILLDTHIWVWWVSSSEDLKRRHLEAIEASRFDGVGISVISCWEVAKLVEYNRLELTMDVSEWMREALRLPEMQLVELTPRIAIHSPTSRRLPQRSGRPDNCSDRTDL